METRSILVEVREWHDKNFGSTYWSSRVWVNGEVAFQLPFQYGYENHGLSICVNELEKRDYLPPTTKSIRELGIDFYYTKSKALRREMFKELK